MIWFAPSLLLAFALGTIAPGQAPLSPADLSPADREAAFKAAGFAEKAGQWRGCDDPGTAGYRPGAIEVVHDLNTDGRPEAIITEGSSFCYGGAETGYHLVGRRADGGWRAIANGPGVVTVLTTKGAGGWADLEIGGPGFCHPVLRWNGAAYKVARHQYEGKACEPV